jgi:two-component system, LytTR family, response regulator
MINAIIVDDEPLCCQVLQTLLQKYCPDVQVSAAYNNANTALEHIKKQPPDLLFLDVEMPRINGFQLLEQLHTINFDLIFTTSYDQYAIKAIRFSALDYLLKPIDRDELQQAVQKAVNHKQNPLAAQLALLFQKVNHPAASITKIALPTLEGLQMVTVDQIITCRSDRNYTVLYLKNKQKMVVSRTLKDVEELLEEYPFIRVHHSCMVNINEINKYIRGEGGWVEMSDGTTVDVSRSRKEVLLKTLLHKES